MNETVFLLPLYYNGRIIIHRVNNYKARRYNKASCHQFPVSQRRQEIKLPDSVTFFNTNAETSTLVAL